MNTVTLTLTNYELRVLSGVLAADQLRAYRDGVQDGPWPDAVRVISVQVDAALAVKPAMTPALALLACQTLSDVYTSDGVAVTVTAASSNAQQALVRTRDDTESWHPLSTLTPSAELLRIAAREGGA